MDTGLIQHLQTQLASVITSVESISGGDINQAFKIQAGKKQFFLKVNRDSLPGLFETEFAGLQQIRSTEAVSVPRPFMHGKYKDQAYLLMEYIPKGQPAPAFWENFAAQLAILHQQTSDLFGLEYDNYIGSVSQPNRRCRQWSEFYAEHRILYLVRKVFDARRCDSSDTRMAEKLCRRLDALFPPNPPALLHGDLWSGNFMLGPNGQPVIYDPAIYYGHREMDIGMGLLFGGFDHRFYEHYDHIFPMEKGWRDRTELTQLYPLLVHLLLFGGHYYQSVKGILNKYS